MFAQLLQQNRQLAVALAFNVEDEFARLFKLLPRRAAVHRPAAHAGRRLQFQSADALHKKFVKIGRENGEEFKAIQQWILRVGGLTQHALVEAQPSKFAVEIQTRVV